MKKHLLKKFLFGLLLLLSIQIIYIPSTFAYVDISIKERVRYKKPIRTKMPPQIIIETVQKQFEALSPEWMTFWTNFVVEDDVENDEYIISARAVEKKWAFSLLKQDCPKPENYDQYIKDILTDGTPVRIDVILGIKKQKSWFRYQIQIYEPMYLFWTNPCYEWNLAPGTANDPFYSKNYTMKIYAENLRNKVFRQLSDFKDWKAPKKPKQIPIMKGQGKEIIGEGIEFLTEQEKQLPLSEQEKLLEKNAKLLEKRAKESEKELKKQEEKELKEKNKNTEKD